VKLLTYMIGTPDEIANLFDKSEKNRKLWDPLCEDCTKLKEHHFAIRYGTFSETKEYVNAMVKGCFLVIEKVNGDKQHNVYVFQKVENKPFLMRVTYFGQVSQKQFAERGRKVIDFLGSLKSFVTQEDKEEELAMVMKTATTEDGGVMASFVSSFPGVEEIGEVDGGEVREGSPSDDETMMMSRS